MPTWHLARGGIQKSIARVQAHFYSPHSSRRVLGSLGSLSPTQTSEPARSLVFHRLSKHLKFRQNTPLRVVFSTLFSVFGYPDGTLSLVFDI